jgi:hypothetical protein
MKYAGRESTPPAISLHTQILGEIEVERCMAQQRWSLFNTMDKGKDAETKKLTTSVPCSWNK